MDSQGDIALDCINYSASSMRSTIFNVMLLTVQNRAQVHRKPTGDLVPFHQGGSSLDLSIQGLEANH
jgi:hypothetical protein